MPQAQIEKQIGNQVKLEHMSIVFPNELPQIPSHFEIRQMTAQVATASTISLL